MAGTFNVPTRTVAIKRGEPVGVLDIDGYSYVDHEVLHLPAIYQANSRRLSPTVTAALGTIPP